MADLEESMNSPSGVQDRRKEDRNPPATQPTYVWISLEKRVRAEVMDESTGGIGLLVPEEHASIFEIGFQVRLQHEGCRRTADIVYVSEPQGGKFRLGLKWIE